MQRRHRVLRRPYAGREPEEVAQLRGKTIAEVLPIPRAGVRPAEDVEPAADAEAEASAAEPETPEVASETTAEADA